MIKFKALNENEEECQYEYKDAKELEAIWKSNNIDMDVPANDAPVFDIEIDGKKIDIAPTVKETIDFDNCAWFEDLLTYLDIEIW